MYFCSGASALLFEVLWFRQAGLAFGSSVWATSLVLASFMGGLALGNALAARWGDRIARPLRGYAVAEILVAVWGVGLVLVLPQLARLFAPLLGPLEGRPALLNFLRLGFAFLLMIVPTAAMGTTLPLVVKACAKGDPVFGRVLGRLYGWNTLGAVLGALAGEAALFQWVGLRGTGAIAAMLNVLAAAVAMQLNARLEPVIGGPDVPSAGLRNHPALTGWDRRLLAVAFLSGGLFLGLEVIWFRFLLLFVAGTSVAFAVMLAVVLLGIACGGLLVSACSRRWDGSTMAAALPSFLLVTGALVVLTYAGFSGAVERLGGRYSEDVRAVLELALWLTFPVSVGSGVVFTLTGIALDPRKDAEHLSTGLLTLFNTLGGMLGSLLAVMVLLPFFGVERSFFVLGATYGVAALCALRLPTSTRSRLWLGVSAAVFAALLAVFPFGLMRNYFLSIVVSRFETPWARSRIAEWREGVSETITYLEYELLGKPLFHRLVTNGHSMSGTSVGSSRYMKHFVYLPVALHPGPKKALLISFGVGVTAKALTDTRSLERIDIVDISRDILELSRVVYPIPSTNPVHDPRVRVHVEDGRFFLHATKERYDLITGEPPPPQCAGVVNLYTREYFALMKDRLAGGGMATYWLPMHSMEKSGALAVTRAFCEVFPGCTLWNGNGFDWVLLGTKGEVERPDEARVRRQWADEAVAPRLQELGFETPELLGATFMAGPEDLAALYRAYPPLVDDSPKRLTLRGPGEGDKDFIVGLTSPIESLRRFEKSGFRRTLWPETLGEKTRLAFRSQHAVMNALEGPRGESFRSFFVDLDFVLSQTALSTPVLWMLRTESRAVAIASRATAEGRKEPEIAGILAADAVSRRQYREAEAAYAAMRVPPSRQDFNLALRLVLLCLDGRLEEAGALAKEARSAPPVKGSLDQAFWDWVRERYGLQT